MGVARLVVWNDGDQHAALSPPDVKFQNINSEYQTAISSNAIFIHPFGAWLDLGYVTFLYEGQLYYVNVSPDVQLVKSLYNRTDTLSQLAKLLIVLKDHIGNERTHCLIALEGQ